MSWPRFSDAMDARMGPGLPGQTLDPRTVEEKMTVWEAQRICIELGYPEAKDWIKDDCLAVIKANGFTGAPVRTRIGSTVPLPTELDRPRLIAELRRMGISHPPGLSDDELRELYEERNAELTAPLQAKVPLESLTMPQLKMRARKLGLDTRGALKPESLIQRIRDAEGGGSPAAA